MTNKELRKLSRAELIGSGCDLQVGIGLLVLEGNAAVKNSGVDLIVDELVDYIVDVLERDKVRAGHTVGDDGFLGGGSLRRDALAVEVSEGLVLVGVLSLDKDHCGVVGVVGVGEVSGVETLFGRLHRGHDHVVVALLERSKQVVKGHVLDLEGLAHALGNVLRGKNVDAAVGHATALIGVHELKRSIVGGGAEDKLVAVSSLGGAACAQCENHRKCEYHSNKLFHIFSSIRFLFKCLSTVCSIARINMQCQYQMCEFLWPFFHPRLYDLYKAGKI